MDLATRHRRYCEYLAKLDLDDAEAELQDIEADISRVARDDPAELALLVHCRRSLYSHISALKASREREAEQEAIRARQEALYMDAYEARIADLKAQHPTWALDQVARVAADEIEVFGLVPKTDKHGYWYRDVFYPHKRRKMKR